MAAVGFGSGSCSFTWHSCRWPSVRTYIHRACCGPLAELPVTVELHSSIRTRRFVQLFQHSPLSEFFLVPGTSDSSTPSVRAHFISGNRGPY